MMAVGAEVARAQVGDGDADAHGAVFGIAGHAHQAAHALGDGIEAGPVGVEAVLAEAEMLA